MFKIGLFSIVSLMLSVCITLAYEDLYIDDDLRIEIAHQYFLKNSNNEELKKAIRGEAFVDDGSFSYKKDKPGNMTLLENKVFYKYSKIKTINFTWIPWVLIAIYCGINSPAKLLMFYSSLIVGVPTGYINYIESFYILLAGFIGYLYVIRFHRHKRNVK